jgi:uncharacterized protein YndB with AHSA1/START domain/DNA-binding transcriptional ArsR family regulator
VFKGLADPSRRKLLDLLFERDGQTLTELARRLPAMTRFGAMKHLRVLEDAGLVTTRRVGREKLHYLNAVPIRLIHDRWIGKYSKARASALAELKLDMEEEMATDKRPAQVYTVFIRAPREKVWDAITKPEFTRRYFFGSEPASGWKAGDRLLWTEHGTGRPLVDGEVIECEKPRRLVHSWIVKYDEEMDGEGPSRVTWELEDLNDGVTKLTAIHDDFPAGSKVYENVAGGWPLVLSGLKTLVETGSPLHPEKAAV